MNSGSTLKTILFWLSIVLLGVMLWKLVTATGAGAARDDEPSYSLFVTKIEAGQINDVTMYLSPNSYELQGEYTQPAHQKSERQHQLRGIVFVVFSWHANHRIHDQQSNLQVRLPSLTVNMDNRCVHASGIHFSGGFRCGNTKKPVSARYFFS